VNGFQGKFRRGGRIRQRTEGRPDIFPCRAPLTGGIRRYRKRGCPEFQGKGIDAVAQILRSQAFSIENVSQMASAAGACDFRAPPAARMDACDGVRQGIIKTGPAASGIEFVFRPEQRRTAFAAGIDARLKEADEFPGKGRFRSLVFDNAFFRFREGAARAGRAGIGYVPGGGNPSIHGHDSSHAFRNHAYP
jgi:hypothetical protein